MAHTRARTLREVELLARIHTKLAIDTLADICGDVKAPESSRISAANSLLDRGWGKPTQPIVTESEPEHMSDSELAQHVTDRLTAIAADVTRRSEGRSEAGGSADGADSPQDKRVLTRVVH